MIASGKIQRKQLESQLKVIEVRLANTLSIQKSGLSVWNHMDAKRQIREAVLEVYRLGVGYVCNYFNLKPFIRNEDFAGIGKITDDVYRQWFYASDARSAMIALTSITLAVATISKANQIMPLLLTLALKTGSIMRMQSLQEFVRPPTPAEEMGFDSIDQTQQDVSQPHTRTESNIDQPEPIDLPAVEVPVLYFVWETEQDNKVCDECEALAGQRWRHDDTEADIPIPVDDTHPNCRCRIVLETEMEEVDVSET